jgi:hypothetical protein
VVLCLESLHKVKLRPAGDYPQTPARWCHAFLIDSTAQVCSRRAPLLVQVLQPLGATARHGSEPLQPGEAKILEATILRGESGSWNQPDCNSGDYKAGNSCFVHPPDVPLLCGFCLAAATGPKERFPPESIAVLGKEQLQLFIGHPFQNEYRLILSELALF